MLRRAVRRPLANPDLPRLAAGAPARHGLPLRRRRRRAVRRLRPLSRRCEPRSAAPAWPPWLRRSTAGLLDRAAARRAGTACCVPASRACPLACAAPGPAIACTSSPALLAHHRARRALPSRWCGSRTIRGRCCSQAARAPGAFGDPARAPALHDFIHRMMYYDTITYLPDDILVKVDRASMAVSLEARAPLLDHRVVEFAWRLPLSAKVRDGQGKWLLRQLFDRHLPPTLSAAAQAGLRRAARRLAARAAARLGRRAARQHRASPAEGFFEPAAVRRKWAEHLSGAAQLERRPVGRADVPGLAGAMARRGLVIERPATVGVVRSRVPSATCGATGHGLRCLHAITGLAIGGAEWMLYRLLAEGDRERFAPTVLSLMTPGAIAPRIAALDVPIATLDMRRGLRPACLCFVCAGSPVRSSRICCRAGCTTAISPRPPAGGAWSAGRRWSGRSIIRLPTSATRSSHAPLGARQRPPVSPDRRDRLLLERERAAAPRAGLRRRAHRGDPERLRLRCHQPDPAARPRLCAELGIESATHLIGMLTRAHPMKDHGNMVHAIALLVAAEVDVHLILAGRGVDDPEARSPGRSSRRGIGERTACSASATTSARSPPASTSWPRARPGARPSR